MTPFPCQWLWGNILLMNFPVCTSLSHPSLCPWPPPLCSTHDPFFPLNTSPHFLSSSMCPLLTSVVEFVLSLFRSIFVVFRMIYSYLVVFIVIGKARVLLLCHHLPHNFFFPVQQYFFFNHTIYEM